MNKSKGSFVKKAALLAIAGFVVRFIGFLYRVPLTNLIKDEGMALYSAGYDLYSFLLILSSAGLPAAISKMVSERVALGEYRNAKKVFSASMLFAVIAGLLGSLVLFFAAGPLANTIGIPGSKQSIISLSPTIFIVAVMSVYRGYFQGLNYMTPTAISQIVEQIFNAVTSIYLAYFFYIKLNIGIEMGAAGGTMGTGIGAFAGLLTLIVMYQAYKPMEKKTLLNDIESSSESRKRLIKVLLSTAFPIVIGAAVFSITNLVDMRMVMSRLQINDAFTFNEAQILFGKLKGKYVPLITLPVSLSAALATAVVPNISGSFVLQNYADVQRKTNTALRVCMILAIPSAIGLSILGVPIISMLFPATPEGGELLNVGGMSIIFLSLSQIATGILQGINRVYIPALTAICGAIVKVVLNYFLIAIPGINIYGAIISTIACYIVTSFLNVYFVKKYAKVEIDHLNVFFKPLFASIIMSMGAYISHSLIFRLVERNSIATLISVILAIIIYTYIMILIRGFSESDILLLPKGNILLKKMKEKKLI